MSRRAIFTSVLIFSCLAVSTGCHRNRAKTQADIPRAQNRRAHPAVTGRGQP